MASQPPTTRSPPLASPPISPSPSTSSTTIPPPRSAGLPFRGSRGRGLPPHRLTTRPAPPAPSRGALQSSRRTHPPSRPSFLSDRPASAASDASDPPTPSASPSPSPNPTRRTRSALAGTGTGGVDDDEYEELQDDLESLSIDMDEVDDDLTAFQQDELVRQALTAGVDLTRYSADIDSQLQAAEQASIDDYVTQSTSLTALHGQLTSCDGVLVGMSGLLGKFQNDLGAISAEIESLQRKSKAMSVQLNNRKEAEQRLYQFVHHVYLPESLVHTLLDGEVNERYMQCLYSLHNRILYITRQLATTSASHSSPRHSQSVIDVIPALLRLKLKSVSRIRLFLLERFHALQKPKTNIQIKQKLLIKYRYLYEFLLAHTDPQTLSAQSTLSSPATPVLDVDVAADIRQQYQLTLSHIYTHKFRTYLVSLTGLLAPSTIDKTDLLGSEEGWKGGAVGGLFASKKGSSEITRGFMLSGRDGVLGDSVDDLIIPHIAEREGKRYTFERLYKSSQQLLMDTATSEYDFIVDFFGERMQREGDRAGVTEDEWMREREREKGGGVGGVVSGPTVGEEERGREGLSATSRDKHLFHSVFQSTIALFIQFLEAHLATNHDVLGVLLLIRVLCQHNLQMQYRRVHCFPASDTRVLTDKGFAFLDEIESRIEAGETVLYGCYETRKVVTREVDGVEVKQEVESKALKYCTGELVIPTQLPKHLVEFTSSGEEARWTKASGPYGKDNVPEHNASSRHVSLRVTPEHKMFVQTGNVGSSSEHVCWTKDKGSPQRNAPPRLVPAQDFLSECRCSGHEGDRQCPHSTHVRMVACAEAGFTPQSTTRVRAVRADLGLRDDAQFDAFIELLGFWLGNGSMDYNSSDRLRGYVSFDQVKRRDMRWLMRMVKKVGLSPSHWTSSTHLRGSHVRLLIKKAAWCAFFEKEFGVKYNNLPIHRASTPTRPPSSASFSHSSTTSPNSPTSASSLATASPSSRMRAFSDDSDDAALAPTSRKRSGSAASIDSDSTLCPGCRFMSVYEGTLCESRVGEDRLVESVRTAAMHSTNTASLPASMSRLEDPEADADAHADAEMEAEDEPSEHDDESEQEDEEAEEQEKPGNDGEEEEADDHDSEEQQQQQEPLPGVQLPSIKWTKSVKWLPNWVLCELSAVEMRLLIRGLHRADGSWKDGRNNEIYTSGAAFRDQLMQALLQCGYAASTRLMYPAGTIRGYKWHDQSADQTTYTTAFVESLSNMQRSQYRPIEATQDSWAVSWTDTSSSAGKSNCWPSMARLQCIKRVPYSAERDGRVWCVNVDHVDHLIIAQRAQRNVVGGHRIVTKQSRPIVVSNCLDATFDRMNMMLWPHFKQLFDAHVQSVSKLTHIDLPPLKATATPSTLSAQAYQRPLFVVTRYAYLTSALWRLNEPYRDDILLINMRRLRVEVDKLLQRTASRVSLPKMQLVFLINQYQHILAQLRKAGLARHDEEAAAWEQLCGEQVSLFAEEELSEKFAQLVGFVKQTEQSLAHETRQSPAAAPSVDLSALEPVVKHFAKYWRVGVESVHSSVRVLFSDECEGSVEVLRVCYVQLLLYYKRMTRLVHEWARNRPQVMKDIIPTNTLSHEMRKYTERQDT